MISGPDKLRAKPPSAEGKHACSPHCREALLGSEMGIYSHRSLLSSSLSVVHLTPLWVRIQAFEIFKKHVLPLPLHMKWLLFLFISPCEHSGWQE